MSLDMSLDWYVAELIYTLKFSVTVSIVSLETADNTLYIAQSLRQSPCPLKLLRLLQPRRCSNLCDNENLCDSLSISKPIRTSTSLGTSATPFQRCSNPTATTSRWSNSCKWRIIREKARMSRIMGYRMGEENGIQDDGGEWNTGWGRRMSRIHGWAASS